MDVLEALSAADTGQRVHYIDNFTISIPWTVSNCVPESNSLIAQGQHGIGNLTLAYFNLITDPITSCSSADVSTFNVGTQSYYGKLFIRGELQRQTVSLVPVNHLPDRESTSPTVF